MGVDIPTDKIASDVFDSFKTAIDEVQNDVSFAVHFTKMSVKSSKSNDFNAFSS